jgi:hypothetical protein
VADLDSEQHILAHQFIAMVPATVNDTNVGRATCFGSDADISIDEMEPVRVALSIADQSRQACDKRPMRSFRRGDLNQFPPKPIRHTRLQKRQRQSCGKTRLLKFDTVERVQRP